MDFSFKNYQIFKLKKYLKKKDFFFLFQSSKFNLKKWIHIEQNLKKLKLNYYKPLNSVTVNTLKKSIYKNFNLVINGFIILIDFNYKTSQLDYDSILKSLNNSFSLISIKLNNKIYSPIQLKRMKNFSYKKNMFNFHKTLDNRLKFSYVLTTNKKKVFSK